MSDDAEDPAFAAFIESEKAKDEWDSGPPIEYDEEYVAALQRAYDAGWNAASDFWCEQR